MPKKVTQETIDRMFKHFCNDDSIPEIAKKFKVCTKTVMKYRKMDEWDKRKEEIRLRTRARFDYDIVRENQKNLQLISAGKSLIAKAISEGRIKPKLRDLTELIKTELLIVGEPDSRLDVTVIEDVFRNLTDNELKGFVNKLPDFIKRLEDMSGESES